MRTADCGRKPAKLLPPVGASRACVSPQSAILDRALCSRNLEGLNQAGISYMRDSDRISACCAASSGRIATSGNTLTSTVRTASGVPSAGWEDASDGT